MIMRFVSLLPNLLLGRLILLGMFLGFCISWTLPVAALPVATPGDLSSQPVTEVKVNLGNSENELKFFPNQLDLIAGKRYKLRLENPSPQKHYFTAKDFADVSWTQKVEAGKVEIKGAIRELELKPGAEAEWVIVPIKPGTYTVRCPIAGHTEAGMTGVVTVSAA